MLSHSRFPSRSARRLRLVLPFFLGPLFTLPVSASIGNLDWQPTATIDDPVSALPEGGTSATALYDDEWWVVYAKAGEIYAAQELSATDWATPFQVSNDPADSRNPSMHTADDYLIVVWEDDRTGHSEVWSRVFDGTSWGPETCLSDDAVPSRSPSVAGAENLGFVAWEEGTTPSRIDGRWFEAGVFDPVITVASGAFALTSPVVALGDNLAFHDMAHVAWVDARHGATEIYSRNIRRSDPGAGDELRVTDLPGSAEGPSIATGPCCGDLALPFFQVAFEHTAPGGVTEVWSTRVADDEPGVAVRQSADDGVPSVSPSLDWVWYSNVPIAWCGELGGAPARFLLGWTDEPAPGAHEHQLILLSQNAPMGTAEPVSGEANSRIGGEAFDEPRADVLQVWIEDVDGVSTLRARSGDILSCNRRDYDLPWTLVVSPSGEPATVLTYVDACTGAPPLPGVGFLEIEFEEDLDGAVQWDPMQDHPVVFDSPAELSEPVVIPIAGGGCAETGAAFVRCNANIQFQWIGVKSPDVDGDCAVRDDDVAYVASMVGTDDFCADLDGSGLVDEADVAIAELALGDHCSNVTDVPDGGSGEDDVRNPVTLDLRARPNPSSGTVRFALEAAAGPVTLQIFDAAGRLVSDQGEHRVDGARMLLGWDGRGADQRAVSTGMYFARATTSDGRVVTAPVMIVR